MDRLIRVPNGPVGNIYIDQNGWPIQRKTAYPPAERAPAGNDPDAELAAAMMADAPQSPGQAEVVRRMMRTYTPPDRGAPITRVPGASR